MAGVGARGKRKKGIRKLTTAITCLSHGPSRAISSSIRTSDQDTRRVSFRSCSGARSNQVLDDRVTPRLFLHPTITPSGCNYKGSFLKAGPTGHRKNLPPNPQSSCRQREKEKDCESETDVSYTTRGQETLRMLTDATLTLTGR